MHEFSYWFAALRPYPNKTGEFGELRVEKIVKDYVNETEKIVAGWFKRGIVNLEPDALL